MIKRIGKIMSRIFVISDIHTDYSDNLNYIKNLSSTGVYQNNVLILAGDVSDDMNILEKTFQLLKSKFAKVFYVPGNHDLWVHKDKDIQDSIQKFYHVLSLCDRLNIIHQPVKVVCNNNKDVWIVPLYSWYSTPEDNDDHTLYVKPSLFEEDFERDKLQWMDNACTIWPHLDMSKSQYFANLNSERVDKFYDAPVITFSHFVPRKDLIGAIEADFLAISKERNKLKLPPLENPIRQGAKGSFNFTRYAGSSLIENQLRKVKAIIHVYGHQHRNRDRIVDGVRYVSHCLGNPGEQREGLVYGISDGAKEIWP